MKKILSYAVLCLAISVASCNKAEIDEKDSGFGILSMNMSVDAPLTKASMSQDELLKTASVKIYRDKKGLVRSYTMETMPSPLYLAAGNYNYRVDVEAGEVVKQNPAKASFEQKSYKGSELFTITANQVNTVKVDATVSNAVTQISFGPTVSENFQDGYTFTIGLDADDSATQLVYNASNSGAEGYFIIDGIKKPEFSWTFAGTLKKDGSSFSKTGTINNLVAGNLYKMNLVYTVKDGELGFTLMVDDSYSAIFNERIEFEPVSTGIAPSKEYEFWATRATLHADVDETENAGKKVQFAYRTGNGEWIYKDASYESTDNGNYHLGVNGLIPSTEYTYKLVIDGEDAGDPAIFTTDDAPNLPNAGFEHYSIVTGKYNSNADKIVYKFYNPDCSCDDSDAHMKFWASGNGDEESTGSLFPGDFAVITTIDTKDYNTLGSGKCSVRAQSQAAMGAALAAGNLFTGQFVSAKLEGSSQTGTVNFGRKWTSRPSALKVMCKYTTGTMDFVADSGLPTDETFIKGTTKDRAQIKIAIGTWKSGSRDRGGYGGTADSPVQVITSDVSTHVDFNTDGNTIANGDVVIFEDRHVINQTKEVSKSSSSWMEIIIPLNYRDDKLDIKPTHIVISCAASQYGDYFTGSSDSKLWLDDFELIYE